MDKKDWIITVIVVVLIIFVIIFWSKFIIKEEEVISIDYCEVNTDCVWAVNPSNCCINPVPLNKDVVELDEDYILYQEGVDYLRDYPKKEECFSEDGRSLIAGCIIDNFNNINYSKPLICINNKCGYDNFDDLNEKVRCRQDGDCILAVNLSKCCYNFFVTNLETVEKYSEIIPYGKNQSREYYDSFDYPKPSGCICPAIYIEPPTELKCINSRCNPPFY